MSIRYRVNSSRSLVTVIIEDSLTPRELRHFQRTIRGDEEAVRLPHMVLISDRLATLAPAAIVELADAIKRRPPVTTAPQAIVAFTDLHFGQARICLSHLNVPETQVCLFRELREALHWLGFREGAGRMELQILLTMN